MIPVAKSVTVTVKPVDDPPKLTDVFLPQRAGLGFPIVLQATYIEDGARSLSASIDWGDASRDQEGGYVDNPSGDPDDTPVLAGVHLIEPPGGQGDGQALGQHLYRSAGLKTVRLCVADQSARQDCREAAISVQPLVSFALDMAPVNDRLNGNSATIDIALTNAEPDGAQGLSARQVSLQGRSDTLTVTEIVNPPPGCTLASGALRCELGTLAPGQQLDFSVRVAGHFRYRSRTAARTDHHNARGARQLYRHDLSARRRRRDR